MKYKITVQEVVDNPEKNYPDTKTIYEQTIETDYVDWLKDIIKKANEIEE